MLKSDKVIIDSYWYLCQSKLPNNQSVIRRDLFDKMMLSIIRQMRDKDEMIESLKKNKIKKDIDVDINYDLHEGRGEDNEIL